MKTATSIGEDRYELSEPIHPNGNAMSYPRVLVVVKDEDAEKSTGVYGLYPEAGDWSVHPTPILSIALKVSPATALTALGYALA